jgi:hypothetical protein
MTITFHLLTFRDATGAEYAGEVFWSKDASNEYQAKIARVIKPGYVDLPIWKSEMGRVIGREAYTVNVLVRRAKQIAQKRGLVFVSERATHFAPVAQGGEESAGRKVSP